MRAFKRVTPRDFLEIIRLNSLYTKYSVINHDANNREYKDETL